MFFVNLPSCFSFAFFYFDPQQYRQEVEELNASAGRRPTLVLAHGAAHESSRVQALERENSDLRTSVMAYQQAMKIVMSKFKEQVLSDESCMPLAGYYRVVWLAPSMYLCSSVAYCVYVLVHRVVD